MQRVLHADGEVTPDLMGCCAKVLARELVECDIEIDTDAIDFTVETTTLPFASLNRLHSSHGMVWRRTPRHIRGSRASPLLFIVVQRGRLKAVRSQGSIDIAAGEAAIIDTSQPFHLRIETEPRGRHGSLHLGLPSSALSGLLGAGHRPFARLGSDSANGDIARQLLDVLVQAEERLDDRTAAPLIQGVLQAIAGCLAGQAPAAEARSLVEERLRMIRSHVRMNLSDLELSQERVARSCGISPRYLCHLLKTQQTTFSELLWQSRLARARELLTSREAQGMSIREVAYRCGYKSAAHFSRVFASSFGSPPRTYRRTPLTQRGFDTPPGHPAQSFDAAPSRGALLSHVSLGAL